MKRLSLALIIVLALALSLSAFAGSGHGKASKAEWKCEADITTCLTKKMAAYKEKGWWGVELDADEAGNYTIKKVIDDSPAHRAGFAAGDQIVTVNGIAFNKSNKAALKAAKTDMGVGSKVKYVIARNGNKKKVTLTLGEVPKDLMASWIGYHMMEHHAPVQMASK